MESNTKYLIIGIVVVVLCCLSSIGGGVGWYFYVNSVSETPSTTDTTKTDAPKTDAPKTDAPKTDTSKTDTPKTEAKEPKPAETTKSTPAATADKVGENWLAVKNKTSSESLNQWAHRIYNKVTSGASAGEDLNCCGVNHVAGMCLPNNEMLTQSIADCVCENPCQWYPNNISAAKMCDCAGGAKAINFV